MTSWVLGKFEWIWKLHSNKDERAGDVWNDVVDWPCNDVDYSWDYYISDHQKTKANVNKSSEGRKNEYYSSGNIGPNVLESLYSCEKSTLISNKVENMKNEIRQNQEKLNCFVATDYFALDRFIESLWSSSWSGNQFICWAWTRESSNCLKCCLSSDYVSKQDEMKEGKNILFLAYSYY